MKVCRGVFPRQYLPYVLLIELAGAKDVNNLFGGIDGWKKKLPIKVGSWGLLVPQAPGILYFSFLLQNTLLHVGDYRAIMR